MTLPMLTPCTTCGNVHAHRCDKPAAVGRPQLADRDQDIRDLRAEVDRLRGFLLWISQSTALRGETCRLMAQDALGGFAERGEGEA